MPIRLLWDGSADADQVDSELVSKCITASPEAFAYVAGLLLDYAHRFPGSGLEDDLERQLIGVHQERKAWIAQLATELLKDPGCYEDTTVYKLRQNPANPCQLQQSLDGGSTWSLAFDFSKCKPRNTPADDLAMYDRYQDVIQDYRDQWTANPTVSGFTPNLVYDGTGRDADRDRALCFALGSIVDACKQARIEADKPTQSTTETIASAIVSVGIVIGGVATGGVAWAVYAAVAGVAASVFIKAGFDYANDVTSDQYDDVRDDIVCCMYTALKGATLSKTDFQTSLDSGCGFEDESLQAKIAGEIEQVIQSDDMYLAMLKFMDEALGILENGYTLPDCPCGWTQEWTGAALADWQVRQEANPADTSEGGTLVGGVWQSTYAAGQNCISISVAAAAAYTGTVTVAVDYDNQQTIRQAALQWRVGPDYHTADAAAGFNTGVGGINTGVVGTGTYTYPASEVTNGLWVRVYLGGALFDNTHLLKITRIVISGTGSNPF